MQNKTINGNMALQWHHTVYGILQQIIKNNTLTQCWAMSFTQAHY